MLTHTCIHTHDHERTGRGADVICAAHYSLEAAVRMIKPGSSVCGFRLGVRMCVCEVMLLDSPSRAQRTHTTLDHRRTPFYAARMVQLSLHWRRFNGELLSIRFLCFLHMSDSTSPVSYTHLRAHET